MNFYSVSIWIPGGHTDRYAERAATPAEAAKAALAKYERSVMDRLKGATGRWKRDLERVKVPQLIEVHGADGRVVAKFSAREIDEPRHRNAVKDFAFSGYDLESDDFGLRVKRGKIDTSSKGDYGADPLGDGTFRMVPSGDIVDFDERNRRLNKKK